MQDLKHCDDVVLLERYAFRRRCCPRSTARYPNKRRLPTQKDGMIYSMEPIADRERVDGSADRARCVTLHAAGSGLLAHSGREGRRMRIAEIAEFADVQDDLEAMSVTEVVIQSIVDESKDPPIAWQSVVILATPDAAVLHAMGARGATVGVGCPPAVVELLRGLVEAATAPRNSVHPRWTAGMPS